MLKILKKSLANLKEDFRDFQEKIAVFFESESDGIPDYCDESVAQDEYQTAKSKAVDVSDVDLPEDYIEEERLEWEKWKENNAELEIIFELAGMANFGHGYYTGDDF